MDLYLVGGRAHPQSVFRESYFATPAHYSLRIFIDSYNDYRPAHGIILKKFSIAAVRSRRRATEKWTESFFSTLFPC